jgi:MPBQ/MSBQ methyltransferase
VTRVARRAGASDAASSAAAPTARTSAETSEKMMSGSDLAAPALPSHGARAASSAFEVGVAIPAADANIAAARAALAARGYGDSELFAVAKAAAAGLAAAFAYARAKKDLDTPGRPWMDDTTVGREYDAWTEEQILEYYWGEHIHLGYYTDDVLARGAGTLLGCKVKDFVEAKLDFVEEMAIWAGCAEKTPRTVLDVGCGIGGASRHLAKGFGEGTSVTGITLSPKQVARATELAEQQGVRNADFRVMNALAMDFPDNSFDLVWACESGEHMPDKKKYVEEMVRVLKPGGTLVIATWCQRDDRGEPFSARELTNLNYLYKEWAHPYFISIDAYAELVGTTGKMGGIDTDDWTRQTIASWRHSVWAGVWDPLPVFSKPKVWYKTVRDIVCLERMHRAFDVGLMQYGMIKAVKTAR